MVEMEFEFFDTKYSVLFSFYYDIFVNKTGIVEALSQISYFVLGGYRSESNLETFITHVSTLRLSRQYQDKSLESMSKNDQESYKKYLQGIINFYSEEEAKAQLTEREFKYLYKDIKYLLNVIKEFSEEDYLKYKDRFSYIDSFLQEHSDLQENVDNKMRFKILELKYLILDSFYTKWLIEKYSIKEAVKKTYDEILGEDKPQSNLEIFIAKTELLQLYREHADIKKIEDMSKEEKDHYKNKMQELLNIYSEEEAKSQFTEDEFEWLEEDNLDYLLRLIRRFNE